MFPAKIYNLRLDTSIKTFLKDLEALHKTYKWKWTEPTKVGDYHWRTTDVEIEPAGRHSDDAISQFLYNLTIPGVRAVRGTSEISFSYNHRFRIELPREYPARVDSIKVFSETPIYHPRFRSGGMSKGCVTINGEIDRILMDLIFQVLLDPARVQPPNMYRTDHGTNSGAMSWYMEAGPDKVFKRLFLEWEQHGKKTETKEQRTTAKKGTTPLIRE